MSRHLNVENINKLFTMREVIYINLLHDINVEIINKLFIA